MTRGITRIIIFLLIAVSLIAIYPTKSEAQVQENTYIPEQSVPATNVNLLRAPLDPSTEPTAVQANVEDSLSVVILSIVQPSQNSGNGIIPIQIAAATGTSSINAISYNLWNVGTSKWYFPSNQTYTTVTSLFNVPYGNYTIYAYATDTNGNTGYSTANVLVGVYLTTQIVGTGTGTITPSTVVAYNTPLNVSVTASAPSFLDHWLVDGSQYDYMSSSKTVTPTANMTVQATVNQYTTMLSNSNNHLIYTSIYDGYQWIVKSRPANALEKHDLNGTLIASATIPALNAYYLNEAFNAYVFNGLVYVPNLYYGGTNTVLTIFNETNLNLLFQFNTTQSDMIQVTYDSIHNKLLFGTGTLDNNYWFWVVTPSQSLNASAYQKIIIGSGDADCSPEIMPIVFNGKVYAGGMYSGAGGDFIQTSYCWSSTDLSTWTLEWTKIGTQTGSGSFFPHISANAKHIVVGIIDSGTTGKTTYRYMYKGLTSDWAEYDTGIMQTIAEDHPNVVAIDSGDLFLLETSARFTTDLNGVFWLFNASSGDGRQLFTLPDFGYDDRWFGFDTVGGNIYIPDLEINSGIQVGGYVIVMPWSTQLTDSNPTYYTITPTADANSTITPNKPQTVASKQKFDYYASTGFHISQVLVDGSPISLATYPSSYTFTNIASTHTIAVTSAINTYTIAVSADTHSIINPSVTGTYNYGDTPSYSFIASTGYTISHVTLNGTEVSTTSPYNFGPLSANYEIKVSTTANQYTVTTSAVGGTITPTTTVNYGDDITVAYSPNLGYYLSSVIINGSSVSTTTYANSYPLTSIGANYNIVVNYAINTYTISPSADANSEISPNTPQVVNYGGVCTFIYNASAGYHLTHVYVNGTDYLDSNPTSYTFTNIQNNYIIQITSASNNTFSSDTAYTIIFITLSVVIFAVFAALYTRKRL